MSDKKDSTFIKHPVIIFIGLVGLLVVIWFLSGGLQEICQRTSQNMDSLSALFSGLAFAGIIVSLLLQREDLKLQKEELSRQFEELAGQKDELERQRKLAERNEFDRFYMFLFKKIDSISSVISLDDLLKDTRKEYKPNGYSVIDFKDDSILKTDLIKYRLNANKKLFEYFKMLYKYVKESKLDIDKQQYINILLSSLDADKKILIYLCFFILSDENIEELNEIAAFKEDVDSNIRFF